MPLALVMLAVQTLALWLSFSMLRDSGVTNIGGRRNPLTIAGAPAGLEEPLGRIWAGLAAGLAALALIATVPARDLSGGESVRLMLVLIPPFVGIAYAALLARAWEANDRLNDSSGLRGACVGLLPLGIDLLFVSGDSVGAMPSPDWYVTGSAILLAGVIAAIATLLGPRPKQSIIVTAGDKATAPATVVYNPLGQGARAQRFLCFDRGEAQLLVLTRTQNAQNWILVDSADEQLQLPIHDRTLSIWNLSRLSQSILHQLDVTDAGGNVALSATVGQLMLTSRMEPGSKFNRRALEAAHNLFFQNPDLQGWMARAARDALNTVLVRALTEKQLGSIAEEVRKASSLCDDLPDNARFLRAAANADTERLVEYTAARLQNAITDVEGFRTQLKAQEDRFHTLADVTSLADSGFEAAWLAELAVQIDQAGEQGVRAGAAQVDDAHRVLELIGLKLSTTATTLIGRAKECAAKLAAVRKDLKALTEAAEARHEEALKVETQHAHAIEIQVVGTGSLSREERRQVIARRVTPHLPKPRERLEGQPRPTPISVRYQLNDDDDADEVI
ncbi:hypothetical protein D0Z70_19975 [Sphingobium terrigena]|uniref:Uncharacterized protein n=2 Tax=Sphingobium terrigena TaxID=2304063 RepID=A0A418YMT5_9SPHN|nr:hypothetical protein D0Z70_19975 [Sphingobium terrigena]